MKMLRKPTILILASLTVFKFTHAVENDVIVDFDGSQAPGSGSMISHHDEKHIRLKPTGELSDSPPYFLALNGPNVEGASSNGTAHLTFIIDDVEIFSEYGHRFRAKSVDLAEYSTSFSDPITVNFTGFKHGGGSVSVSFTTDGIIEGGTSTQDFETFVFPEEFNDLRRLVASAADGAFSLDNLYLELGVRSPTSSISFREVASNQIALPSQINEIVSMAYPSMSQAGVVFRTAEYGFTRYSIYKENEGEVKLILTLGESTASGRLLSNAASTAPPMIDDEGSVYWEVSLGSERGVVSFQNETLSVFFDESDVSAFIGEPLTWYAYRDARIGTNGTVFREVDGSSGRYLIAKGADFEALNLNTELTPDIMKSYGDFEVYKEGFIAVDTGNPDQFNRIHLGSLEPFTAGVDSLSAGGFLVDATLFGNGRWIAAQLRFAPSDYVIGGWSAGHWFRIASGGTITHDGYEITGVLDLQRENHSIDHDSLLFTANTEFGRTIFLYRDGVVYRLIGPGDRVDFEEVTAVSITRYGLEGNKFAVAVSFSSGKKTIHVGDFSVLVNESYPEKVNAKIALRDPKTITIQYPTKNGQHYHLLGSSDLNDFDVLSSRQGDGNVTEVEFNISNYSKFFFMVENATYVIE